MRERILAHRGCWVNIKEENTQESFRRALENGFGIETDIRDFDGKLVISHDPPRHGLPLMSADSFFSIYQESGGGSWLALNIKADGLAEPLRALLAQYSITRYFVFDMSVPDMRSYLRLGMATFTRRSDVETEPAYYEQAAGVWLDSLEAPFVPASSLSQELDSGKMVAAVSPELHARPHLEAWQHWRNTIENRSSNSFLLCTDFPEEALRFWEAAS